ncbi:hypothetical protein FOL47_007831, partial [Perkinsus chesapeaki]
MQRGSNNAVPLSQESTQSHQTSLSSKDASNAEDDLSKYHKKNSEPKRGLRRRSDRIKLQSVEKDEPSASPVSHGHHTRSQPLTEWQLRKALGKVKKNPAAKKKSPWKSGFQPRKHSKKPSKKVQDEREARCQKRIEEADGMLAHLEEDNPLDDISWTSKKRLA